MISAASLRRCGKSRLLRDRRRTRTSSSSVPSTNPSLSLEVPSRPLPATVATRTIEIETHGHTEEVTEGMRRVREDDTRMPLLVPRKIASGVQDSGFHARSS